jgi:CDP-diacylglycerol--glycerol-3-phosphate 3-phosphatidyltransferase
MSEPTVSEPAVDPPDGRSASSRAGADGPGPVRAPRTLNVANGLTLLRIVLVPIFVLLMIASQMTEPAYRIAAALAFGIASMTDFADGWIARTFNLVTSFGKLADPIADKALTGTALVLLSIYDALPWWVTIVVLIREIGVTLLRLWVARVNVIPASPGGKIKTVLQIVAIAWYIWPFQAVLASVGPWLMAAAVVVTVVTGADYVVRVLRIRRAAAGR